MTTGKYKVTNMNCMFGNGYFAPVSTLSVIQSCASLKTIDVTNWDTSNVTDMESMFGQCGSLTNIIGTLDIRGLQLSTDNVDIYSKCGLMFFNTKLNSISLKINSSDQIDEQTFRSATSLGSTCQINWIKEYNFDGKYGPAPNADGTVDLSNWYMTYIFDNYISLPDPDNPNPPQENISKEEKLEKIKEYLDEVFTTGKYKVTSMAEMFKSNSDNIPKENTPSRQEILNYIDLSNWDTSNVTDMSGMFKTMFWRTKDYITDIKGISNWDTSNVTNMNSMFASCSNLTSLDVSNWDTSKVTDMIYMFESCSKLATITGTIDLTSCTNYSFMLYSTSALTSINIKLPGTGIDSSKENDFVSNSCVSSKDIVNFLYDDWNLDRNFIASAEDSKSNVKYYTVTISQTGGSTGELNPSGTVLVKEGDNLTITATPPFGACFLGYTITQGNSSNLDLSSSTIQLTNIQENYTVIAEFSTYTIS